MRELNKIVKISSLAALLLAGTAHRSFALGPGGSGYQTVGQDAYQVSGVGPLSGEWDINGAVTAWGATMTNPSPDFAGRPAPTILSEGTTFLHIVKGGGIFHVHFSGGQWQTPTIGITSNNGVFNSLAPYGSPANPHSPPTISYWVEVQPSPYWSADIGQMAPIEGVESGIEFVNPTFFVSQLNNTELGSGYGYQLNLFYGPASVNVQYSAPFGTNRTNILSSDLTYNLNADGSDFIIGFGHITLGHTGNPGKAHAGIGLGFSEVNDSLVGLGFQWMQGPWTFLPELQYQWLPKESVSARSGDPKPLATYYAAEAMIDVTYALNTNYSLNGQLQYAYQNNDKHDPNAALFGNWMQYDSPAAPGSLSPGTGMTGAQVNLTWQHQNFFARPTIAYTHLTGFARGTGYGLTGNNADQVTAVLEIGFLLGKYAS